jgi:hypothetical protein
MNTNLQDFVRSELNSARKQFKRGLIILTIFTLILVVYFQWLKGKVRGWVEPSNLAEATVWVIEENMPSLARSLRTSLETSAPQIVDHIGNAVIDQSSVSLRVAFETSLNKNTNEWINQQNEATNKIFAILIENKIDELKAISGSAPGMTTPKAGVATQLDKYLGDHMKAELNAIPEETAQFKLRRSHDAILNINDRLIELATKKKKTRRDVMTSRLIGTWWGIINTPQPGAVERMKAATGGPR